MNSDFLQGEFTNYYSDLQFSSKIQSESTFRGTIIDSQKVI
ncbi:MAG: hypothetical protein ACP5US_07160 [Candidatus Kryptoniota bacterium]